jgi:hypothetical protein
MPPKKSKLPGDKPSEKGLFDFINGITTNQSMEFYDDMTESEKKSYRTSRYMIHRFLSMNSAWAPIINILQQYPNMPDRSHYQFLVQMLPKGKQFSKYIKSAKETKYESWLVEIVVKHFQVSQKEALDYLDIYYEHNRGELRLLCEMYGVDSKIMKRAKL